VNQLVTELENWLSRVHRAWAALHLDQKKNQLARLQERMQESHFWDDRQTAEHISQEAGRLQHQIDVWSQVRDELTDLLSLASDETLTADITERLLTLGQTVNQLEFELLLQGPHRRNSTGKARGI
jgi:DNA-binding transcriptional regulator GbsR (MarR family)